MRPIALRLAALILLALPITTAPAALSIGARAPAITTPAALAGRSFEFNLAQALTRGPVVLYFFPAAFTPGCTLEAHQFAEASADFAREGATLIGLSAGAFDELRRFSVEECRNKFAVGSATPQIIADYDVVLPQRAGLSNRTSYVIAPGGQIIAVHSAMNPNGHVAATLAAVRQWRAAHPRRASQR